MRITTWAWFESKQEQKEFVELLNNSKSDMDAVGKLSNRYPEISLTKINELVSNWKKEINKKP